jgi:UDP-N-acetylglucosamine acyltransferase
MIHPSAVIDASAQIHPHAEVGPNCKIAAGAMIGRNTRLISDVVILGRTILGSDNVVSPFSVLGGSPQDLRSLDDQDSELVIGDNNYIREYVTINRGTAHGGGVTTIGNNCLLMTSSHVGHDCTIDDNCVVGNATQLAGHAHIGGHAKLGALSAVAQFARLGPYSFLASMSSAVRDLPPYSIGNGHPGRIAGANLVALRRHEFGADSVQALRSAYKIWGKTRMTAKDRIAEMLLQYGQSAEVRAVAAFMSSGSRNGVAAMAVDR